MNGHERAAALTLAFSLALMLLLYFILVPRYGLVGAGFATSVMLTVTPIAMALVIRRHLGFWPIPERASVVSFWWVALASLFWLKSHLDLPPLAWLAGGVAGAVLVFCHIAGARGLAERIKKVRAGG